MGVIVVNSLEELRQVW